MTQLHAGGKFDQNSYKVSGGLHGVGVSVVNALSEWLELRIFRGGKEHFMRYSKDGEPDAPLAAVGDSGGRTGTEVTFLPSTKTFTMTRVRLRHPGAPPARIGVPQFRRPFDPAPTTAIAASNRIRSSCALRGRSRGLRRYLDRTKTPLWWNRRSCSSPSATASPWRLALQWTDSYHETVLCFTNNIPATRRRHPSGWFRAALTRQVNAYAASGVGPGQEGESAADRRRRPRGADLRALGQGAGSEILQPDQGQAGLLRGAAGGRRRGQREAATSIFEEHPAEAKRVVAKVVEAAARARRPARRAN